MMNGFNKALLIGVAGVGINDLNAHHPFGHPARNGQRDERPAHAKNEAVQEKGVVAKLRGLAMAKSRWR